jgi:hypothetical protein
LTANPLIENNKIIEKRVIFIHSFYLIVGVNKIRDCFGQHRTVFKGICGIEE